MTTVGCVLYSGTGVSLCPFTVGTSPAAALPRPDGGGSVLRHQRRRASREVPGLLCPIFSIVAHHALPGRLLALTPSVWR